LLAEQHSGWRASEPGNQVIRLVFNQPQNWNAVEWLAARQSKIKNREIENLHAVMAKPAH
jgi:hypothetical protein